MVFSTLKTRRSGFCGRRGAVCRPRAGGESDRLEDTINYADVAQIVADRITGEPFDLIEALAWAIAGDLLRVADSVEVTVHKPQAPIDQDFQDVSVTVRRSGRGRRQRERLQHERLVRGGQSVIGVGANMGQPSETVQSAMDALDLHPTSRCFNAPRCIGPHPLVVWNKTTSSTRL